MGKIMDDSEYYSTMRSQYSHIPQGLIKRSAVKKIRENDSVQTSGQGKDDFEILNEKSKNPFFKEHSGLLDNS